VVASVLPDREAYHVAAARGFCIAHNCTDEPLYSRVSPPLCPCQFGARARRADLAKVSHAKWRPCRAVPSVKVTLVCESCDKPRVLAARAETLNDRKNLFSS